MAGPPQLMSVQDVVVALHHRRRLDAGEVRPRVGFGEAGRHRRFSVQNGVQILRLDRLRRVVERRPGGQEGAPGHHLRRPGDLGQHDDVFHRAQALAAVILGDHQLRQAIVRPLAEQFGLQLAAVVVRAGRPLARIWKDLVLDEGASSLLQILLFRRELEIHLTLPRSSPQVFPAPPRPHAPLIPGARSAVRSKRPVPGGSPSAASPQSRSRSRSRRFPIARRCCQRRRQDRLLP